MTVYRAKIAFGPWSKGRVFTDLAGNVGRTWAARNLVEEVAETQDVTTAAMHTAPVDRMMRPDNRARRGNRA